MNTQNPRDGMAGGQQGLFKFPPPTGGGPNGSQDDHPEDIKQALKILSGQVDFGQEGADNGSEKKDEGDDTLRGRFERGMLKKHELKNAIQQRFDYKVQVLDLATKKGAETLETIFNTASSDPFFELNMTEGKTVLDGSAETGFRVIVTVVTWRTKTALPSNKPPPSFEKPADPPPSKEGKDKGTA